MTDPLVSVIMPWLDRSPEMMRRAVASIEAQTYSNYELVTRKAREGRTVGWMRNLCVEAARGEIIAHADEDDWSHPNRLAEQVALLQASGADCVGYRDILFWREPIRNAIQLTEPGEAWFYSNPLARGYALGTSLIYHRAVWERVPFDDVQKGEDDRFCRKVGNVEAVTSIPAWGEHGGVTEPRMIASIHGGNTSSKITPGHQQWRRVPEWDSFCATMMKL